MTYSYDSTVTRPPMFQEFRELWLYRDLLNLLIINGIKTRYKRSAMGVVWTLLNPLLNTAVLTIAFSQLMRFEVKSYPIYLLTGLICWNFFAQTTLQAANTLVWGSGLLKRIYLPRTIFAISVLGNGLVNFGLALIPLFVVMLIYRHPISVTFLLLPVPVLFAAMFTLGVALWISTFAIFFTDVVDLYNIFLQAWFFLTPIVYPLAILPPRWAAILRYNPVYVLVDQVRRVLYDGQWPSWQSLLITAGMTLFIFASGWWLFTKRVDDLAYRI